MIHRLYRLFIAPRQRDEDIRNREIVLNVLLAGTLLLLLLGLSLLLQAYWLSGSNFLDTRIVAIAVAAGLVSSLYSLSRRGHYQVAAFMLVWFYFLLATVVVFHWGVTTAAGVLVYGLVIVLAGILLGPRYSLYAAGTITATLICFQIGVNSGTFHPNLAWTAVPPSMGDVLGFSLIFGVIALVTWLFNYQMERSLHRAHRAEEALLKQKMLLEDTVVKRTRQLQEAQLEKVQHMYRFAELGQLSTALLHELANHLTTLTLDIEGLEADSRSHLLRRAKRSMCYIDDMVLRVREQLHGKSQARTFGVSAEISDVISILTHKAAAVQVRLVWQPPADRRTLRCHGEPVRMRQLIANLVSNAIDAYEGVASPEGIRREVVISATVRGKNVVITIEDWGKGIAAEDRKQLFEPFFSTKKTGMGMGLFIAKQIVEEHFGGKLTIDGRKPHTAFVITLTKAGA